MKGIQFARFAAALDDVVQYLAEPIGRIFGPDDDFYPAIGVQPYDGDPFSRSFNH